MRQNAHSKDSEWLSRCEDFEQSVLRYKSVRFSHFVSPHDYAVFMSYYRLLPDVNVKAFGGSDDSERVILGFFPDFLELENTDFPITPLVVSNLGNLTHRDVLGAVLGLGIKREMVGDIYFDDGVAVIMCESSVADFIMYNLKSVGRQNVTVTVCDTDKSFLLRHKFETIKIIVTSLRLDAVLAATCKMSRNDANRHVISENVNLNFCVEKNPDKKVMSGDVISVRHHGRFAVSEVTGETKKGRLQALVSVYGA